MELVGNMEDADVHVVTPKRTQLGNKTFNSDDELAKLPENVSVHYLGTAQDTFKHYSSFQLACRKSVPDLIEKYDIDIVHSQNTMPDLFLSPQKLGVPFVTTIHTLDNDRVPAIISAAKASGRGFFNMHRSEKMSLLFAYVVRAAGRAYFKNSRYYIAVSHWSKGRLLRHYAVEARRVRVIYNGVDKQAFTPLNADLAEQQFPALADTDCPKVLFLSRLTAFKGVHLLMKAIPRILSEVDAHFIFAGHGDKLAASGYENNITELGHVAHHITPYLHAVADMFILPSFYENFPLSILEAMATGRAAIASNIGGIPELITHGRDGWLVRSGSVDDIVSAITTLINDDALRKDLGRCARNTVEDHFSWKKVATEVMEYYASILNEDYAQQHPWSRAENSPVRPQGVH
jgi:glycosyltransferase involved in cell wall biosynthesis